MAERIDGQVIRPKAPSGHPTFGIACMHNVPGGKSSTVDRKFWFMVIYRLTTIALIIKVTTSTTNGVDHMANHPKADMRVYIKEQCDLAVIYAEDGAYSSSARVLEKLAVEVRQHADLVMMPPCDPVQRPTERQRMIDLRNELVTKIADEFATSNIEYTCAKVVHDFAGTRIVHLTNNAPYLEFRAHHMWAIRKLRTAVGDMVHARWKAAQQ